MKETTSNYREMRNLVETLEKNGMDGDLAGYRRNLDGVISGNIAGQYRNIEYT